MNNGRGASNSPRVQTGTGTGNTEGVPAQDDGTREIKMFECEYSGKKGKGSRQQLKDTEEQNGIILY